MLQIVTGRIGGRTVRDALAFLILTVALGGPPCQSREGSPPDASAPASSPDPKPASSPDPKPDSAPRPHPRPPKPADPGPRDDRESKETFAEVRVLYATNRGTVAGGKPMDFYSSTPALPARVEYGVCTVSIPKTHTLGNLEEPWFFQKWNPEKHVTVLAVEPMTEEKCFAWLAAQMGKTDQRDLLVYVHGYYNSFTDAARRTAQVSHDLGFNGVPAMFSWPSLGAATGYMADEEAAQVAVPHLTKFLRRAAAESGATRMFIIAHSLGARAVTQAISNLKDDPGPTPDVVQLILAAPDINQDVFKDQVLPRLGWVKSGITVYASSNDRALQASAAAHNADRVGQSRPPLCILEGVEFIDASAFETDLGMNHSNAFEVPAIIHDIYHCTIRGKAAGSRFLRAKEYETRRYWELLAPPP